MNKKIIAGLCAFFTLFGLCSCNKEKEVTYNFVETNLRNENEASYNKREINENDTLSLNCSVKKGKKDRYAYTYEIVLNKKENKKESINELFVDSFEDKLVYFDIVTEETGGQFFIGDFCLEYDLKGEHIKENRNRENANKFLTPTFEFSLPKHAENIEAKVVYTTYYDELYIPVIAKAGFRTLV